MKRYILSIILIISSVANADNLYLKNTVGLNYIPTSQVQNNMLGGSLKLKESFPVVGFGIGYEFDNLLRIETVFDYYFLFTQLERTQQEDEIYNISLNTKISDVMINVIQGIQISDRAKCFIGGGVGVASIQDEGTGYVQILDTIEILQPTYGKHVYRLAYKFTSGLDYKIRDGVTGEIAYNFYDLGKNKPKQIEDMDNMQKRRFLIHNITLGLRFDL
jgi:opacity protein-like surface antigen